MAKKSNSALFSSLLYIIVGALLVIFRSQTLEWAMTAIGVVFAVSGIIDLVKKNMLTGAISLVIGISVIVLGWTFASIVLLVLGILITIKGIVALIDLLKKKRSLPELLIAILTIVLGLMLAFGNALDVMIVIVGVLLIADGVIGLINSFRK